MPYNTPHNPQRPEPTALASHLPSEPLEVRAPSGATIPPDFLDKLEHLDDVIFSALRGDPASLDQSARLYRRTSREAPRDLIEESREQYVRQAQAIVENYRRSPDESLGRTFAALEILMLVAED